MSQKPRAGVPARAASANKAAPKEVVAKADPAALEPDDVEADPVIAKTFEPEPIPASPTIEAVSVTEVPVEAETVEPVAVQRVTIEPAAEGELEPTSVPSYSIETIAAASDLAAAPANVISETATAAADTVAAVTSEAVETAASIEPTKPTITQGIKSMMKSTEDFVAFGQANLEAFVKSGQIWSAGVQELTKQIASSAKASFDESVSTFKAISTARSVKEAMDLQSNFAKAALEKAMAESNKLTDASIKLTEQTLAPITARVTVAVETFGKAA